MYKATYKCRMCGELFDGILIDEAETKNPIFVLHSLGKSKETPPHICPDGSIGYADFVGFRKENDDG